MDSDLKCNRLNCRKTLVDKAVVTVIRFIQNCMDHPDDMFAYILSLAYARTVECANELFNVSRLCPACETSLTEPDDVVVILKFTAMGVIDEREGLLSAPDKRLQNVRSVGFKPFYHHGDLHSYQIHQENSFQHAVARNLNDKNAQLQKQLENVIREANGEINLLGNKVAELERDLELERRRVHDLQDTSREREKEYQKLKAQLDRVKRRALLGPDATQPLVHSFGHSHCHLDTQPRQAVGEVDIGTVVGGMEAIGMQRTPLVNRIAKGSIGMQQARAGLHAIPHSNAASTHRHPLNTGDRSFRANSVSDRSDSAHEVENLLLPKTARGGHSGVQPSSSGWGTGSARSQQRRS